jgi:phosphatidylinositol-3,4,5-trisphosphate 3-phosphatase and dual-specificity protein phosphatase PTEN
MAAFLRRKVSKKKRRFQDDGFDLDLSYIDDDLIAMGFPSMGTEALFRNKYEHVYRFLESRHKDHYRVYNLCAEDDYQYPFELFHNRVACYQFYDHNPPPFEMIRLLCVDVERWLAEDKRNVAVIHCKAGKGRTGTMICAYLVHARRHPTPDAAMQYYAERRTHNNKGLTIPSQIRYVRYYSELLASGHEYVRMTRLLVSVRLHSVPRISGKACRVFFTCKLYTLPVFKSETNSAVDKDHALVDFNLERPLPLTGDVKLEFFHETAVGRDAPLFQFWFNTFFVHNNRVMIHKSELDKAIKDKTHKKFSSDFSVELVFMDTGLESVYSKMSGAAASAPAAAAAATAAAPALAPTPTVTVAPVAATSAGVEEPAAAAATVVAPTTQEAAPASAPEEPAAQAPVASAAEEPASPAEVTAPAEETAAAPVEAAHEPSVEAPAVVEQVAEVSTAVVEQVAEVSTADASAAAAPEASESKTEHVASSDAATADASASQPADNVASPAADASVHGNSGDWVSQDQPASNNAVEVTASLAVESADVPTSAV